MWPFSREFAEPAPICKDCRWSRGGLALLCAQPDVVGVSVVDGEPKYRYCEHMRNGIFLPGKCGKAGKYFEPRPLSDRMNVGE